MMNKKALALIAAISIFAGLFLISCGPEQQVCLPEQQKNNVCPVDSAALKKEIKDNLSLAWENYKNKQYDRAIEQFRKVLSLDPENEKAYKYIADACLRHPDSTYIDTAFNMYKTALTKFPENEGFHTGIAYVFQKMSAKLTDKAKAEKDSAKAAGLNEKAAILEDSTLNHFYIAFKINSKNAVTSSSIGTIWLSRNALDSTILWYERSVVIDSNQTPIWDVLSKIYQARAENKKSAYAFENLHRIVPDEPEYLLKMGQYLAKDEQFAKAVEILKKYVDSNPKDYRGYQYMGLAYSANKNNTEALKQLKEAEKLNTKSPKLLCDIASTYAEMKQYDSAEMYLNKARKEDANYGYIQIIQGDVIYKRAKDQLPEDGSLNMEIKCQFLAASKIYQRVMRDPDWSSWAKTRLDFIKPYLPTAEEIKSYQFMQKKPCAEGY
jgi:tetratricopeptide (TPR) repeat protein